MRSFFFKNGYIYVFGPPLFFRPRRNQMEFRQTKGRRREPSLNWRNPSAMHSRYIPLPGPDGDTSRNVRLRAVIGGVAHSPFLATAGAAVATSHLPTRRPASSPPPQECSPPMNIGSLSSDCGGIRLAKRELMRRSRWVG